MFEDIKGKSEYTNQRGDNIRTKGTNGQYKYKRTNRQYQDQKDKQANNTSTKRTNRQYKHQKDKQTIQGPKDKQ